MSGLVVDASAALIVLRRQPGHETVRQHLDDRILSVEPLLVPPVFWLEIVNVLARRYRYQPPAIVEAVYELEQVGLSTAEVGRPGVLAVIDAVGRFGLTAYDAAYLVLAESWDVPLLTADVDLAAAAGDRAILVAPEGGVAEPTRNYVSEPSWAAWKGAVAYLAELRSAVS
jgi:predicted nucleic acid-binding protein